MIGHCNHSCNLFVSQSLGLLRSKAGQYGKRSQDWLAVASSSFPRRLTSRLHSKSNPLHCCSEQEEVVSAKKLRDEFYLYLSRDKTCHKQYTIYMLPQESWGKTPNVYMEGSPHPPYFFSGRSRAPDIIYAKKMLMRTISWDNVPLPP